MSGTFPSTPKFNSLNVTSIQPTFITRSMSGKRQARQIGGQYWKMTATFPPMTRAEFAPINAFIMAQRGRYESFSLILPVLSDRLIDGLATAQDTSTSWESLETKTNVDITYSTSGSGTGVKFSYNTNNASPAVMTITAIPTAGSGYASSDTITLKDGGFTTNTAVVTVNAVNGSGGVTGISNYQPTTLYTGPKVKGANQTGRTITTDGWNRYTGSAPYNKIAIKAGDYLKFASHDKVYMCMADATANTAGEASITIEPALRVSPPDQNTITMGSVPFNVALTSGAHEFATGVGGLFTYEVDFEEVL